MNTDSVQGVLSLPALQPHIQQLLQLQQFQVTFWVPLTQVKDDLQPLQQLLQNLLRTRLGCLAQILFIPSREAQKYHNIYYWVTGRVLICTKNCSSCLLFLLYILYWFALKRRIYFCCFIVNLMKPHTHSRIKCEFEVNFVSIIKVPWNLKVMTGL